jgi:transcriptional regulator with XRE-family HTH domain
MVNNFGMTPKRFADATGVENSVLFRELKGQRKLSLDKAINYAKALACDPVDLLFEKQMCKLWGSVDLFNSHDYGNETAYIGQIKPVRQLEEGKQDPSKGLLADQLIQVPRDIYRPEIKAILIDSLGSHLHNHFVYYYYTDNSIAVENKLVVVGKEIPELEEIGMDTTQYFFGILQIQKGKQILINPEPTSDQKQITVGPFSFIAPVVATVKRGSMRKDHDYHQSISYAEDIKEAEEKILATQEKVQAELKKQLERMEYDIKKLNELSEKEKEKLKDTFEKKKLYKSLEDIPAFIRKKIG